MDRCLLELFAEACARGLDSLDPAWTLRLRIAGVLASEEFLGRDCRWSLAESISRSATLSIGVQGLRIGLGASCLVVVAAKYRHVD
jgi:hypothetical protein